MERFVIIVNSCKPLTIITECSILDVAAALDGPLENPSSDIYYLKMSRNVSLKVPTKGSFRGKKARKI